MATSAQRPRRLLAGRFKTLRALHHGLIANGADLNQAPGGRHRGRGRRAVALKWLDKRPPRKAWLILYTHDVSETLAVGLLGRRWSGWSTAR
jgi:hypothetical protein